MLFLLFVIPVVWGAVLLVSAVTASDTVICPGENVGADGEERPGPMRPGDRNCSVLVGNKAVAVRTYELQQNAQRVERQEDLVHGFLYLAYGIVGVACARFAVHGQRPADAS
ncbi:hypothetical protein ACYF6T_20270 [Streptomyces sp. 7R007]